MMINNSNDVSLGVENIVINYSHTNLSKALHLLTYVTKSTKPPQIPSDTLIKSHASSKLIISTTFPNIICSMKDSHNILLFKIQMINANMHGTIENDKPSINAKLPNILLTYYSNKDELQVASLQKTEIDYTNNDAMCVSLNINEINVKLFDLFTKAVISYLNSMPTFPKKESEPYESIADKPKKFRLSISKIEALIKKIADSESITLKFAEILSVANISNKNMEVTSEINSIELFYCDKVIITTSFNLMLSQVVNNLKLIADTHQILIDVDIIQIKSILKILNSLSSITDGGQKNITSNQSITNDKHNGNKSITFKCQGIKSNCKINSCNIELNTNAISAEYKLEGTSNSHTLDADLKDAIIKLGKDDKNIMAKININAKTKTNGDEREVNATTLLEITCLNRPILSFDGQISQHISRIYSKMNITSAKYSIEANPSVIKFCIEKIKDFVHVIELNFGESNNADNSIVKSSALKEVEFSVSLDNGRIDIIDDAVSMGQLRFPSFKVKYNKTLKATTIFTNLKSQLSLMNFDLLSLNLEGSVDMLESNMSITIKKIKLGAQVKQIVVNMKHLHNAISLLSSIKNSFPTSSTPNTKETPSNSLNIYLTQGVVRIDNEINQPEIEICFKDSIFKIQQNRNISLQAKLGYIESYIQSSDLPANICVPNNNSNEFNIIVDLTYNGNDSVLQAKISNLRLIINEALLFYAYGIFKLLPPSNQTAENKKDNDMSMALTIQNTEMLYTIQENFILQLIANVSYSKANALTKISSTSMAVSFIDDINKPISRKPVIYPLAFTYSREDGDKNTVSYLTSADKITVVITYTVTL